MSRSRAKAKAKAESEAEALERFEKEKAEVISALAADGVTVTPHPYTPTGLWVPLHHRELAKITIKRFPGWFVDHRGHTFKVPV